MSNRTKFKNFFICDNSETIRVYPENYWIASIKDGKLIFDSWDSAIVGKFTERQVNSLWSEIKQCREDHKNISRETNGRFPVIVQTNDILGVQYWTEWQIKNKGFQTNTDNSRSYFISKL